MQNYRHISATELNARLKDKNTILIDVREPVEFQAEHIPGAINMPFSSWDNDALKSYNAKEIILQCASGMRSCRILDQLEPASDIKLYNLTGGIQAWKKENLPTKTSGKQVLPIDRQVQLMLGSLIVIFSLLGFFIHTNFFAVPTFIGAGLINAGLTGWCGMAMLVTKMPWNKSA